jgi:uncharacterized RDD family membrane protein YckC
MELEDRITLSAPEGIDLEIVLAGAASRLIAGAIDFLLQAALVAAAGVVSLDLVGGGIGVALFAMAFFAAVYLYDVLFEVLASGRTPGKRMTHLRVVRAGGAPVDLPASAIRNLLRLIDILPSAYLIGIATILVTKRNQRLGDLAAGTLVIREPAQGDGRARDVTTSRASSTIDWDVSAVSAEELAAVRRFLERRDALDAKARGELAQRLAQGLRVKVAGAPAEMAPESFLEALTLSKSTR